MRYVYLFIVSIFFIACAPSEQDAIMYNNKIIKIMNHTIEMNTQFAKSIDNSKSDAIDFVSVDKAFQKYKKAVNESLAQMNHIEIFENGEDLKEAAYNFLTQTKRLVDVEWNEILNLFRKGKDFSVQDAERIKKLGLIIDMQLTTVQQKFNFEQKRFAEIYKFKLK